jgi:hypothetical protein
MHFALPRALFRAPELYVLCTMQYEHPSSMHYVLCTMHYQSYL